MIIRKANENEIKYILHNSKKVAHEASMGYVHPHSDFAKQMALFSLANGGYYLVAVEDGIIKGWILVDVTMNPFENETIGLLAELFVLREYRKMRIGERLMIKALEDLKSRGLKKVQLNVFAGNPAKKLYERIGFRQVSTVMEISLSN